jgi:membrane protease YdiL (CAAX protease family)
VEPRPDPAPPEPRGKKSALAFFGVLLLLFLPGIVAQAALLPAGLAWSEVFAFLLPALVATAGSNLRAGPYLKLGKARPAAILLGALAGGAGYLLAGAVMTLAQRLLPEAWVRTFDPARLFERPARAQVLLAAIAIAVAPPCEEIAFRGYVQTTLALRRPPAVAVAGAAALFAAMHLDPVRFPALLLLGLVFGWLTWRAGSIWPAVAAHATNNAITSALVFAVGLPEQEADPAPFLAVLVTGGLGAAALAPILRAYRAVTPGPPGAAPGGAALAPRDPLDPSIRFSFARVPPSLLALAALGAVLLAAIGLAGALLGVPAR